MQRKWRLFVMTVSLAALLPIQGTAQEESMPAAPSGSAAAKADKKQQEKIRKELSTSYGSWLDNDVVYIITPEERQAFLQLSTNEEREQFIESFWDRRNPDPESPVNAFKEEHYRRLAHADEHFASGIPGRKTDRGRIYIIWGAPDEIESHPMGGTYDRPMNQGGGTTTTYPWELWRYRYLEGIGENIELEFVDPSSSGEYHLAFDPCEKDSATHVPGMGASLSEQMGLSTRAGRFSNSNGTTCPMPIGGVSARDNEFERMHVYFGVQHAPPGKFKDLEEKVTARVVGDQLPFQYRADFLRATSNTVLVPITVQLKNRDLSYKGNQGIQSAVLELYGRITDVGGRVVETFEDVISRSVPDSLFVASKDLSSIYQKSIPLRSGLYRLDIVIKDTESGKVGVLGTALRVPRIEADKLDASSLIVADRIEPVRGKEGSGQFVLNSFRLRPALSPEFAGADQLGIYLQLYNLRVDEVTHKTKVSVVYRILKDQQEVWHGVETPEHMHQGGEEVTVERFIPVSTLSAGRYTIEVTAIDLLTNETVIRSAEFGVKAPVKSASPAPSL
jgi:GWxTD domain-containing protein